MYQSSSDNFHGKLRKLIDTYVHNSYDLTKKFPKDELFGATSQTRRATLSIALNYVEGYARQRKAVLRNFLETSYGSLKESEYLISFAITRGWATDAETADLRKIGNEIGAMLWSTISRIK